MKVELVSKSLTNVVNAPGSIESRGNTGVENQAPADEFKVHYSREELEKILFNFQESIDIFNKRFRFLVHDETNRVQVQIIDSETDEVIKEIPPQKVLDLLAAFQKLSGIILDLKA